MVRSLPPFIFSPPLGERTFMAAPPGGSGGGGCRMTLEAAIGLMERLTPPGSLTLMKAPEGADNGMILLADSSVRENDPEL